MGDVQSATLQRTSLRCLKTVGGFDVTSRCGALCSIAEIRLRNVQAAPLKGGCLCRLQPVSSLNISRISRPLRCRAQIRARRSNAAAG